MAFLLVVCCGLTCYFHARLGTARVLTHFFYAPIILACVWWRRKGLAVAVFLAAFLLAIHHILAPPAPALNDYIQAAMFVAIGLVVVVLSEWIARRERALLEAGERMEHINAVLRAIRNVNQLITREKDRDRLLQGACETFIETRGYYNAWIALLDEDGRLGTTTEAGLGDGFLPMLGRLRRGELPHCCRKALTREEAVAIADPSSDCADCPLAAQFVGRSGLAVCLRHDSRIFGVLVVSIPGDLGADEEERGLFADVAGDIAFALTAIEANEKRKRAEEGLRESERRYAAIFDGASEGILTADLETKRFLYANPAMCRILGYSKEELNRMRVQDIHPKESLDRVLLEFEAQARGKKTLATDIPCLRKDGTVIYADINTAPTVVGGRPCNVGFLTDITDRKRAEEALRRSEERFRLIFEHSNDGINMVEFEPETSKRRLLMCNDRYVEMSGYSREQLMAANDLNEFVQPYEDPQRGQEEYRKILRGIPFTGRNSWIRPDGKENFFEWTAASVRIDQKICILGIDRDITERKRMEEQLLQSQKMEAVGHLAGGVAHDFRNQLLVIKWCAERLLRRELVGDEGRDDAREIIKATDRSASLTKQLLAFSRRVMLQPRTVDLPELVQDLSSSLQPMIGEDIRLSLLRSARVCHVHLDPDQLQQAIINLAANARNAMPNGGELTIETDCVEVGEEFTRLHPETSCGLYAVVAVKDTGVGMDAETVGQIFEPFFTTKQGGEGTGLGLSTVYGFVKQSGGVIKVDSTPGEGSTFSLYFPVVAEAEESAKPADEDRESLKGRETILVVEDEESVRRMLVQSLREAGYTVLETGDAKEALPQGEHYDGRIDMLLADVVMPGMGGPELAEHIRKVRPDIAVLHISGYVGRDLPQRGLESGKAPLLIKPFSPEQLLRRIREVLDAAAGRRADG